MAPWENDSAHYGQMTLEHAALGRLVGRARSAGLLRVTEREGQQPQRDLVIVADCGLLDGGLHTTEGLSAAHQLPDLVLVAAKRGGGLGISHGPPFRARSPPVRRAPVQ